MSGVWSLPGWRRPLGCGTPSSVDQGSAERLGLRGAILDLLSTGPMMLAELGDAVRDQWGDASANQIAGQIRSLVLDGDVRRDGLMYFVIEHD